MAYDLDIIIPVYNEQDNIPLILKRFSEVIKRDDIEIILISENNNFLNTDPVIRAPELSPADL